MDGFAADVMVARIQWHDEEHINAFINRAEIWANRYNDVVNRSIVVTKEQKLLWVFGDTDHCTTCEQLNGIVALSSIWEDLGVHPQNPPNDKLECGGWRCQCTLIPTANRQTYGARDAIMRALG